MKIGILQTGHVHPTLRERTGDYSDMFERFLSGRGFTFQTWNVVDMDFPTSLRQAEGWLITGSRHGAYEDLPWIAPLEELIREIYATGQPLVGVCFGHQIIAQALGGRVEKWENGWSVGNTDYEIDGARYALNAWHQDQVTEVPEDGAVVGRSAFCENAAIVYGNRAFTVQPHPEFESDFIEGLIEHRSDTVEADRRERARARLDTPNDNVKLAERIANFLHGLPA